MIPLKNKSRSSSSGSSKENMRTNDGEKQQQETLMIDDIVDNGSTGNSTTGNNIDCTDEQQQKQLVVEYLQRILDSAKILASTSTLPSTVSSKTVSTSTSTGTSSTDCNMDIDNNTEDNNDQMMIDNTVGTNTGTSTAAAFKNNYSTDIVGVWYINQIAQTLLQCCDINIIIQSPDTSSVLPKYIPPFDIDDDNDCTVNYLSYDPFVVENTNSKNDGNTNTNNNNNSNNREYQYRRIDYLCVLLRAMPSISYDVAATICTIIINAAAKSVRENNNANEMDTDKNNINNELNHMLIQAFILFSVWLPVASHIHPLVTNLFQISTLYNNCPLDDNMLLLLSRNNNHNDQEYDLDMKRYILVDAAYNICNYYCYYRKEHSTITTWWDWSCIYTIIHNYKDSYTTIKLQQQQQQQLELEAQEAAEKEREEHKDKLLQDSSTAMDTDDVVMETAENVNDINNNSMNEVQVEEDDDDTIVLIHTVIPFNVRMAILWYSVRVSSCIQNLASGAKRYYLDEFGVTSEEVQWYRHSWSIQYEQSLHQLLYTNQQMTYIWDHTKPFYCPCTITIRTIVPIHSYLIELGTDRIVFMKHNAIVHNYNNSVTMLMNNNNNKNNLTTIDNNSMLVRTKTTDKNLTSIATALCNDPNPLPILLNGPNGSGKSTLVREVARLMNTGTTTNSNIDDYLLEIHVDEETDTKTLIGSYTATDIPGEFEWRPGSLTTAIRTGKWVLIEDLDTVSYEIQASLLLLLTDRLLSTTNNASTNGEQIVEKCHPNFRLFATVTAGSGSTGTSSSSSRRTTAKRPLHPHVWYNVFIEPIPINELHEIVITLFPTLPLLVIDSVLQIFRLLDQSGRCYDTCTTTNSSTIAQKQENDDQLTEAGALIANKSNKALSSSAKLSSLMIGRYPSVRDFFKVLSRIQYSIQFESNTTYITESQRILCLAECYDIFIAACADRTVRRQFITSIAAPAWNVSYQLAASYIETRCPPITLHTNITELGRVQIKVIENSRNSTDDENSSSSNITRTVSNNFAQTNYTLRLMESIGVCVRENEPTLLVGETGTGKTTILQELASLCGRPMIVQNLSLQTDSTDLLGGYRPLEIQHIARTVYDSFYTLFTETFSKKQNIQFLQFASSSLQKCQYKKLSQCFTKASQLGLDKIQQRKSDRNKLNDTNQSNNIKSNEDEWIQFKKSAQRFEQQRLACTAGPAFVFAEGILVDAIRTGKWILLDEINLASSETIQRLSGLLDGKTSSITLTERGDSIAVNRHPGFRLFAAMNPATDVGKKDLSSSVRSRFTEIYVDELIDVEELRYVAARYISNVLPPSNRLPHHTDTVIAVVDLYLEFRALAEHTLTDGGGLKPRYTMRSLARALAAAKAFVLNQHLSLDRSLFEGFQLAFQDSLDEASLKVTTALLRKTFGTKLDRIDMDHPGKRPRSTSASYLSIKPFWIESGLLDPIDWAEEVSSTGKVKFVLTPTAKFNVRRIARAIASGPWPILLEGPTSAGKTTMIEYIAARCGHSVIRINNHEHTDIQEYTGAFCTDSNGSITFQEGLLVQALKEGKWVILDELNLAPSEVLEALNRLLDSNQELYIPELNETIRPHPRFRLFATQNPSGAYGGRKPLSRAFRNRFIEIFVADIPSIEMITILGQRCGCPPTYARKLVEIMDALRCRRSKSGVFLGKDGFITPRDLLRWAERGASTKQELAQYGYMILAERLRTNDEKECVQETIEEHLKVQIDVESMYYGKDSEALRILNEVHNGIYDNEQTTSLVETIAPTRSLLRLVTLVLSAIKQKEPVLLVGDTGCGKTVSVQLLSIAFKSYLHIINCHQTTETSDLLGGLRPVRKRGTIGKAIAEKMKEIVETWPQKEEVQHVPLFVTNGEDLPENGVEAMLQYCRQLSNGIQSSDTKDVSTKAAKRQKLAEPEQNDDLSTNYKKCRRLIEEIETLSSQYNALFEWSDGPLVEAMKQGHMILLDEMSLADDAVLERLNSVLEPSRTLVLAEKGGNDEHPTIYAHPDFQLLATMNPGGDFGKRELSPALRSRFTEIWVPPVKYKADIVLVLERALHGIMEQDLLPLILQYIDWFNEEICNDPRKSCSDLSLSLRDVLSWARFLKVAHGLSGAQSLWDFYIHGARLMHLDGLGLGTALDKRTADSVRQEAEVFLFNQMEKCGYVRKEQSNLVLEKCGIMYGADPFWIDIGKDRPEAIPFNFSAPTTTSNIQRVLRAMQLRKPILLEGSPGVGKTATITALAAVTCHKLVRINLSEQTDFSDLIGSDLPIPESDSGSVKPSFRWCDGVLLSAIKSGDWVLLDELNLASQSVLEGLNSCLDHRSSVFIPELGVTYECPASFRVFAAQNPLSQGGGRKGLPKSFLNRFTKVYVEALSDEDFKLITRSQYPNLKVVDQMVQYNGLLHKNVVELGMFGNLGAPWEFNLRDIFRWGQLLQSKSNNDEGHCFQVVRDLYIQRFRNNLDRKRATELYGTVFGVLHDQWSEQREPSRLNLTKSSLSLGDVLVTRLDFLSSSRHCDSYVDSPVPLHAHNAFEGIARCASLKWPCLIVEIGGHLKDSILRTLATFANVTLVEVCMSASSDVSELVGCFEQFDLGDDLNVIVSSLKQIASEILLKERFSKTNSEISKFLFRLERATTDSGNNFVETLDHASTLVKVLTGLTRSGQLDFCLPDLVETEKKIDNAREKAMKPGNESAQFSWKDGVLIQAMTKGHWIHLKNSNLCPSSVLDRLNPVMEPGGTLLVAESGATDSTGNHQEVRCHPNFRIFLSMDPTHGEVSRAMRNRCVEVSIIENVMSSAYTGVDEMDSSSTTGMQTFVPEVQVEDLGEDNNQTFQSDLTEVGKFSLISRGVNPRILKPKSTKKELRSTRRMVILPARGRRERVGYAPEAESENWDSRIIRPFFGRCKQVLYEFVASNAILPTTLINHGDFAIAPYVQDSSLAICELRYILFSIFAFRTGKESSAMTTSMLSRLEGRTKNAFHLATLMMRRIRRLSTTLNVDVVDEQTHIIQRLQQNLKEEEWVDKLRRYDQSHEFVNCSILDVSWLLLHEKIDKSRCNCLLTPLFIPFFQTFDDWNEQIMESIKRSAILHPEEVVMSHHTLLMSRNQLWNYLNDHEFSLDLSVKGSLIVQWSQFATCLEVFSLQHCRIVEDISTSTLRRLRAFLYSINNIFFHNGHGLASLGTSTLKYTTKPHVPRTADDWNIMIGLKTICSEIALTRSDDYGSSIVYSLSDLMGLKHPVLFGDERLRTEFMGILSTIHIACTNTMNPADTTQVTRQKLPLINHIKAILSGKKRDLETTLNAVSHVERIQDEYLDNSDDQHLSNAVRRAMDWEGSFRKSSDFLLERFCSIQLSPIAEYLCERREVNIISKVCEQLCKAEDEAMVQGLHDLLTPIKAFVFDTLNSTLWDLAEIHPFYTMVWVLEYNCATPTWLRGTIRQLLSTSFIHLRRRLYSNSCHLGRSISRQLSLPSASGIDSIQKITFRSDTNRLVKEVCRGQQHDIPSSVVYSLIGESFVVTQNDKTSFPFATLENVAARRSQLSNITSLLVDNGSDDKLSPLLLQIRYLLCDMVESLSKGFDEDTYSELKKLVWERNALASVKEDFLRCLLSKSNNAVLRGIVDKVVLPLFLALKAINEEHTNQHQSSKRIALAQIYLGLSRFHLMLPDSPIDPGQLPRAKIELIDRELSSVNLQMTALRLEAGLLSGNFFSRSRMMIQRNDQLSNLLAKRKKKENKVIDRPDDCFSFAELYRDLLEVSRSLLDCEAVLRIVKSLEENTGTNEDTSLQQENNWQLSVSCFCESILKKYNCYSDVIVSIVAAIGDVQNGLSLLSIQCNHVTNDRGKVIELTASFPFPDVPTYIAEVSKILRMRLRSTTGHWNVTRALAFGVLASIRLTHRNIGMKAFVINSFHNAIAAISNEAESTDTLETITFEEKDEDQHLNEQFPKYNHFFAVTSENDDSETNISVQQTESMHDCDLSSMQLTTDNIDLLCLLHRSIFSRESRKCNDNDRIEAFLLNYEAGYHSYRILTESNSAFSPSLTMYSGHVMASSLLKRSLQTQGSLSFQSLFGRDPNLDFYKDPNPLVASLCSEAANKLYGRISFLLQIFPGNAILSSLGEIVKKVLGLGLVNSSLGQYMTGLEIILKHSQDWELHCSERVRLGEPLAEISRIISSWRKLELSSWKNLLSGREARCRQQARRHWLRIYHIFKQYVDGSETTPFVDGAVISKRWLWKDNSGSIANLLSFSNHYSESVDEISKLMDSFCLTSPLGEFEERLSILEAFACQLESEAKTTKQSQAVVFLCRCIRSIYIFYLHFAPTIKKKLEEARRPFETRLEQEVKLAKWDEQTYYAIIQSSERNHRSIVRVLIGYDEALQATVSTLIEVEMNNGIRSDVNDVATSTIPPSQAFFGLTTCIKETPSSDSIITATPTYLHKYLSNGPDLNPFLTSESPLRRLNHFEDRMKEIQFASTDSGRSSAYCGGAAAEDFCDSIFERIESLRSEKTTRPMKERALVDLLKELKRQGYSSSKWTIPIELNQLRELFQLPFPFDTNTRHPNMKDLYPQINGAESYYQRCLAEIHRLQSETTLLGSKHMTSRQTQSMVTFANHGMILIAQQRSVCAAVLSGFFQLANLIERIDLTTEIVVSQATMSSLICLYHEEFVHFIETLSELRLFVDSSQYLLASSESRTWAIDTATKLQSAIDSMNPATKDQLLVVSVNQLEELKSQFTDLSAVESLIRGFRNDCIVLKLLPVSAFDTCLLKLEKLVLSAKQCILRYEEKGSSMQGAKHECSDVENKVFIQDAERAVEATVLAVQACAKDFCLFETDEDLGIHAYHKLSKKCWSLVNLGRLHLKLKATVSGLVTISESSNVGSETLQQMRLILWDVFALAKVTMTIVETKATEYFLFYRNCSKLQYVLLRTFRMLISKGFCDSKSSEDNNSEGQGDASGMTFEDLDGTGMGEGEGTTDVTDQLETEEQLLGLKNDKPEDNQGKGETGKQLEEEEAEKGMEMEADFDGDLFDVPDKEETNQDEDNDDEQELDREMGDEISPKDEVIDEKMWGDDEEDNPSQEEKFEENNSTKGGTTDEMMTRSGEESQKEKAPEEGGGQNDQNPEEEEKEAGDDAVNDDFEENYEENHGTNVREDETQKKEDGDIAEMDMPDSLELDGNDETDSLNEEEIEKTENEALGENEVAPVDEQNDVDVEPEDTEIDDTLHPQTQLEGKGNVAEPIEEEKTAEEAEETGDNDLPKIQNSKPQAGLGIQHDDGQDVIENGEESNTDKDVNTEEKASEGKGGGEGNDANNAGGRSSSSKQGASVTNADSAGSTQRQESNQVPNPLKSPGDASKFWQRKLNILNTENSQQEESGQNYDEKINPEGDVEHTDNPDTTMQALGEADETNSSTFNQEDLDQHQDPYDATTPNQNKEDLKKSISSDRRVMGEGKLPENEADKLISDEKSVEKDYSVENVDDASQHSEHSQEYMSDNVEISNTVVTNLAQLKMVEEAPSQERITVVEEVGQLECFGDADNARLRWAMIQSETNSLARRLCEKLRLVLEPLVASKLRGDYRTGKRINMKRVIGYIASGYRKDKIWLRRTKPAKRNYRVLLAVDDSESMLKSGAGDVALKALATLAVGMSQLEVGDIGIASFGNEMRLIHPFHTPFTSESGVEVIQSFQFNQQRTRTALCVQSVLMELDSLSGDCASMQLVFMISDGRIERDSRATLRRHIREMIERNILLVMIIVEGNNNVDADGKTKPSNDRIINMKEVTFENGKPKVKRFIEDYPFPYYIILDDMQSLPEILGEALRQWFEMLTRLQGS